MKNRIWVSLLIVIVSGYVHAATVTPDPQTPLIFKKAPVITPQKSIIEEKVSEKKAADKNPISIALYNPTYILPYYYTASPYYSIYKNQTPNDQKIQRNEFKSQLSFVVPLSHPMPNLRPDGTLNIAYTQLNFWQVYASSQYFRETNYEPELFYEDHVKSVLFRLGVDHQSNGRGGQLERSWNRAVSTVQMSGDSWLVGVKAWALIFTGESSQLHNSDIAKFLGYENILFSYKFQSKAVLSVQLQNLESFMRRGYGEITLSYPVLRHMSLYAQYFNGYGQSLIEYNHRTQAAGVGVSFNDWI
jgi:phospholipase A1